MIRGIHYFSTELKTKIDVIPRGCFKRNVNHRLHVLVSLELKSATLQRDSLAPSNSNGTYHKWSTSIMWYNKHVNQTTTTKLMLYISVYVAHFIVLKLTNIRSKYILCQNLSILSFDYVVWVANTTLICKAKGSIFFI